MDFKSLPLNDQIEKFNEVSLNQTDLSYTKICALFEIPKTTFRDKLKRNGLKYDTESRLIIADTEDKLNDPILEVKPKAIYSDIEKKVNEMYAWYKSQNSKQPLVLDISRFEGRLTARTVKLYDNVLNKLNDIIQNNKQYTIQDIVNTALLDYLENKLT